ncbi:MAG: PA2778 family cysteine peptidase [Pseudomonadaceae bacterium]|nr:PA2778 family cysteine peptidase [Pseudomonadaceae bacterium]
MSLKTQEALELTQTPFHDQTGYFCGPNALATVLHRTGLDIDPDTLAEQVYLPGRKGSLQLELVAATRAMNRLTVTVEPSLQGILSELAQGYPVLILQNLGVAWFPVWHYAVVIGFDPAEQHFILRSGNQRRQLFRTHRLLKTWDRANRWGVVVLNPGELPANTEVQTYATSVAALERVGNLDTALVSYQAGLERWPDNIALKFGAANTLQQTGDQIRAIQMYEDLIAQSPDYWFATNNLAHTLALMGCKQQALEAISRYRDKAGTELPRILLNTQQAIAAQTDRQCRKVPATDAD